MQSASDIDIMMAWVRVNFQDSYAEQRPDGLVQVVPSLFEFEFRGITVTPACVYNKRKRKQYIVKSVVARGNNFEASIADVFDRICTKAQTLYALGLYCPKPGQSIEDINPDRPYVQVFHNDPEHVHERSNLLNLVTVEVNPQNLNLSIGALDDRKKHMHFLID